MLSQFKLQKIFSVEVLYTCFAAEREETFYFSGEAHDFWELVYVKSGQIGVTEDDRIYELEKGDIIFHKPMEFHKIWSRGKGKSDMVILSFSFSGNEPVELGNGIIRLNPIKEKELMNLYYEGAKIVEGKPIQPSAYQLFALKLEMFLISLCDENVQNKPIDSVDAMRYKEIIHMMNKHIKENLSVSDIARLSRLSPSNLKVVFAKFADGGVMKYFNRMKIHFSMELLKQGMSVSEISEYLSYSSQNYFSLLFKKETGISPLHYKKQIKASQGTQA